MYKEFTGRFGKFYSQWAFSSIEKEAPKDNRAYLEKLMCELEFFKLRGDSEWRDPQFVGDQTIVVREHNLYGRNQYVVVDKPEWMTYDEVALVCDHGSLCFGHAVTGCPKTVVIVFTD